MRCNESNSAICEKKIKSLEVGLLDFSLKNRLISYRYGASAIRLCDISPEELYERLCDGTHGTTEFKRPAKGNSEDAEGLIGDIGYDVSLTECRKILKSMRQRAKAALEEQGTSILYLSLGFIEWTEPTKSTTVLSPLVLVPVNLVLSRVNAPFTLARREEEDVVTNPTLLCYFRELGISLPELSPDKESLSEYFERVKALVGGCLGIKAKLVCEASLGLLSFKKISMYNDMQIYREKIKAHPIFRVLAGDLPYDTDSAEEIKNTPLDAIPSERLLHVLPADASQTRAILFADKGISFALGGPPGTGKSQTIANIIANSLAKGKRVLFVSEKLAALRVVMNRLSEVGLDDLALMLHGEGSGKSEIIKSIARNLHLEATGLPEGEISELCKLDEAKDKLGTYLYDLHTKRHGISKSFYKMFALYEENDDGTVIVYTPSRDVLDVTEEEFSAQCELIREYGTAIKAIGSSPSENPWRILGNDPSRVSTVQIRSDMTRLKAMAEECRDTLSLISECQSLADNVTIEHLPELSSLLTKISALPEIPKSLADLSCIDGLRSIILRAKTTKDELDALKSASDRVFTENFARSGTEIVSELEAVSERAKALGLTDDIISRSLSGNTEKEISDILSALEPYRASVAKANELFGLDLRLCRRDIEKAIYLIDTIGKSHIVDRWLDKQDFTTLLSMIDAVKGITLRMSEIRSEVEKEWSADVLYALKGASVEELREVFERTKCLAPIDKIMDDGWNKLSLLLSRHQKRGMGLDSDKALRLCDALCEYGELSAVFDPLAPTLAYELCEAYDGIYTDWDAVLDGIDYARGLRKEFDGSVPEGVRELASGKELTSLGGLRFELEAMLATLDRLGAKSEASHTVCEGDGDAYESARELLSVIARVKLIVESASDFLRNPTETAENVYKTLSGVLLHESLSKDLSELYSVVARAFELTPDKTLCDIDLDAPLSLLNDLEVIAKERLFGLVKPLLYIDSEEKSALSRVASHLSRLSDELCSFTVSLRRLCEALGDKELEAAVKGESISRILEISAQYTDNLGGIDGHFGRLSVIRRASSIGLGDFIEKIEECGIMENILECFIRSFAFKWILEAGKTDNSVSAFSRSCHERLIEDFIRLENTRHTASADIVRHEVASRIAEAVSKNEGEARELIRAADRNGKGISLRGLFDKAPEILTRLKPCLMMSPLSVANLLDADKHHFDLVIFDEASQVFPADAIGSILRADQVIIAGDSRQLPPTSFFTALRDSEDYDLEETSESLEQSILDEFLLSFPSLPLSIHYRSADESIIDFSNSVFYDDSLVTFPAASRNADTGVEYEYVEDGRYIGKVNRKEAERCTELLSRHIKEHPERSVGIIAFSEAQQEVIESAVASFREAHPEYESFFDSLCARGVPFFVKNLESVQGDERDTIIFSICYGKNEDGKFIMNLGPITKMGGERRLNVAVTRARMSIKVVGSVLPSDFSVTESSSLGNKALYEYVKYAHGGGRLESLERRASRLPRRDEFREEIAGFLEENGYSVVRCVGRSSSYKIDIAVESSPGSGEYIAAIECDGIYYTTAESARDRLCTRPSMLSRLGWRTYRVWSSAWNSNGELERKALLDFLKEASRSTEDDSPRKETVSPARPQIKACERAVSIDPTVPLPMSLLAKRPSEKDGDTNEATDNGSQNNGRCLENSVIADAFEDFYASLDEDTAKASPEFSYYNPYGFMDYIRVTPNRALARTVADKETALLSSIFEIVCIEQPIHEEILAKRLSEFASVIDLEVNASEFLHRALSGSLASVLYSDSDDFVKTAYPINARPRACKSPSDRRHPKHISCEEMNSAVLSVLHSTKAYSSEGICEEIAKIYGYPENTPSFLRAVKLSVLELLSLGTITENSGTLTLL